MIGQTVNVPVTVGLTHKSPVSGPGYCPGYGFPERTYTRYLRRTGKGFSRNRLRGKTLPGVT